MSEEIKNIKKIGSKHEVFNDLALKTSGGLKKGDLILNKHGKVVSKRKSEQGKKAFDNIKNFVKKPEELQELRKKKKLEEKELIKEEMKEPIEIKEEKPKKEKKPRKPRKIKSQLVNEEMKEESKGIELKPEEIQEEKKVE